MSELDRIRWQCRRGMLELDLVLARFLERHYAGLDEQQREAFKALLNCSDTELWEVVSGQFEVVPGAPSVVVKLLRES